MSDMFEGMFDVQPQKKKTSKEKVGYIKFNSGSPSQWSVGDFVDYFIYKYNSKTGVVTKNCGQFRPEVLANIKTRVEMCGIEDPWKYVKNFIDWFVEKDLDNILGEHITAEQVPNAWRMMNTEVAWNMFYKTLSSSIALEKHGISKIEDKTPKKSVLLDELSIIIPDGKNPNWREALVQFGIPIVATFMKLHKHMDDGHICASMDSMMNSIIFRAKKMVKNSDLLKVLSQTTSRSPYPASFIFLDWQSRYKHICDEHNSNTMIPYMEYPMASDAYSDDYDHFMSSNNNVAKNSIIF